MFAAISGAASGCNPIGFLLPQRPVYVANGQIAEVAENRKIVVLITNKETGRREKRVLEAKGDGTWYVGRRLPSKETEVK